jgi:hypothetical protein
MEKYTTPEMEITILDQNDVLLTSGLDWDTEWTDK